MVNNPDPRILQQAVFVTQKGAKDRTKIRNGPVYDLSIVQLLVEGHGFVQLNTDSRLAKQRELEPKLETEEIRAIILALRNEHYEASEISDTTVKMKVDSDEYCIWWNRNRQSEDRQKLFGTPIYLKFGFRLNIHKCLIISIHKSDRN